MSKKLPKIEIISEDPEIPWYERAPMIQKFPRFHSPQPANYGGFCDLINSQRRGSLKTDMLPKPRENNFNNLSSPDESPLLQIIPQNMLGFSFMSILEAKKNSNEEELIHPQMTFDRLPRVSEVEEKLEDGTSDRNEQIQPRSPNQNNDHLRRKERRAVTEVYENPNVHLQYKRIKYRKNRNFGSDVKQTVSVGDFNKINFGAVISENNEEDMSKFND